MKFKPGISGPPSLWPTKPENRGHTSGSFKVSFFVEAMATCNCLKNVWKLGRFQTFHGFFPNSSPLKQADCIWNEWTKSCNSWISYINIPWNAPVLIIPTAKRILSINWYDCPYTHTCLRREQHLHMLQVVVLVQHHGTSAMLRFKAAQVDVRNTETKTTRNNMITQDHQDLWRLWFLIISIVHIKLVLIPFDNSRCFQQNQNKHWPSWWSKAMGTADSIRAPWLGRKPSWTIIPKRCSWSWEHWQTLNSKKHNHTHYKACQKTSTKQ